MNNPLYGKHILSMRDLSKSEIELILNRASDLKERSLTTSPLQGKILASLFFEPSTRTRLSFESAMYRLGGQVISVCNSQETSINKGESLSDAIKVISSYADAIVLRHPHEGAARLAAEASSIPVINAGDGANEHPSQTLLDLFAFRESHQDLNHLKVAFVGDLKHSRTVHSLALAAAHYNLRMFFISPESLMLPEQICHELRTQGVQYSFHLSFEELLPKLDILYMTRIQKERFDDLKLYAEVKDHYILRKKMLSNVKPHFKVMAPLPRLQEIDIDIDQTPYAYYFQQAADGIFVRQALLELLLQPQLNLSHHDASERTLFAHSSY